MDPGPQLISNHLFITLIVFVWAVTIHEFSHALVARLLGDDTAQKFGRLTLNPLAHLDPIGLLCLIIFRIGWARPVPIDEHNFRYPRISSALVGLAGPTSNFLTALIALYGCYYLVPLTAATTNDVLTAIFKITVWINIMLGVFNLIPLPPLDGSHLLRAITPQALLPMYYQISRYSIFILLILLMLPQTHVVLLQAMEWVQDVLECLVI
jgi:Zn-dependent protease